MIRISAVLLFACMVSSGAMAITYTNGRVINGQNNLTLEGDTYTSSVGNCLTITNSNNITVDESAFVSCYGVGIDIENSTNITVKSSYFEQVNGGVYALTSSGIVVTYNTYRNIWQSGHADSSRGQFAQFDHVIGPGNEIGWNRGVDEEGASNAEDIVNMYMSNGTAGSPINIHDNCFSGGGPSDSGGGILLGDGGGSYQIAQDNVLINPRQYGVAIAGSTNNQLLRNTIFAVSRTWTNVGMYITANHRTCDSNTISDNIVDYTDSNGVHNGFYNSPFCMNTTASGNTFPTGLGATITCGSPKEHGEEGH